MYHDERHKRRKGYYERDPAAPEFSECGDVHADKCSQPEDVQHPLRPSREVTRASGAMISHA
jgi:hypothetical protein